jgi:hypothetical protein
MGVDNQLHALVALLPGKETLVPTGQISHNDLLIPIFLEIVANSCISSSYT